MNLEKRKRVSDIITVDEIEQWTPEEVVTITADTGAGKSYFIKNVLYQCAKDKSESTLIIVPRTNLKDHFQKEIDREVKNKIISIMTYQNIEDKLRRNEPCDLSKYKYIVCDEHSYWINDAAFNKFTDLSLHKILNQRDSIKILMSATGEYVNRYIKNYEKIRTRDYIIPKANRNISNLTFYNKDESLEEFMELAIENNLKTIFFIQSAEKAYNLYKKFKEHSIFNCSQYNSKYSKYIDTEEVSNLLENERFEKLILITTTTLDVGVNIIDREVKNIVCDVKDTGTLIQCIGRKRIQDENDTFDLCIKNMSNKSIGGRISWINSKLERARYFKEHGYKEFIKKYPRENDSSYILYDCIDDDEQVKKLNILRYSKMLLDTVDYEVMIRKYNKHAYCKHIANELGFYDKEKKWYNYDIWERGQQKMNLEEYLNSIVGKRLSKDDQKDMKEVFKENGLSARTLGINTLNGYLKDTGMNYIIVAKQSSHIVDGKKKSFRYWEVIGDIQIK